MKLYLNYRTLSVVCSTAAYLLGLSYGNYRWYLAAFVSVGMITACAIGTFLYKKIIFEERSRVWLLFTLILEQVAYGIFISMSGGVASPYLWCFLGYIFLVAAVERYRFLLALSVAWSVFCISVGEGILYPGQGITPSAINTVIGIFIVFSGFYALRQYMTQLDGRRKESELLSLRLQEEKEATEQGLHQITTLYDTVNLFTITNRKQSMDEMARLLTRSIAPKGCVLLKFKMGEEQELDEISSHRLKRSTVEEIQRVLKQTGTNQTLMADGQLFQVRVIGRGIFPSGLLAIALEEGEGMAKQLAGTSPMLPFYQDIIETVFKDMDMQKSLENGIIREEQHRIANEIHDTVIQKLFGISCSLKVLESSLEKMSKEELAEWIQNIEQSAGLTMKELREAIYGIRFEGEKVESFEDKLKLYLQEAERLSAVSISFDSTGDLSLLSVAQKTVAYRIICESVNNGIRHGHPTHIEVRLVLNEKGLSIWIGDNGRGFDSVLAFNGGTGIKNIHSMASLMKGTCAVHSKEGKGTTVEVFLPR